MPGFGTTASMTSSSPPRTFDGRPATFAHWDGPDGANGTIPTLNLQSKFARRVRKSLSKGPYLPYQRVAQL